MRNSLLLLLAVLLVGGLPTLSAQELELGIKAGGALYSGDLSPREFSINPDDVNFAGGAYLRYRPSTRLGIRVNGNFGMISAERSDLTAPNEDGVQTPISRNFRSKIAEFNAVLEYDLFYLGDPASNFLAGYVYGGAGVLSFNPESTLDGVEYFELQPLRTQAQGAGPQYDATPYELTRVVGILGGGIRVRFAERFVIGLEVGGRITGTDYLDDITDQPVNYLDVLGQENGGLAARFSNPAVQDLAEVGDLTYRRGGDAKDYYFVGGLTFGITLGEGGNKKTGCYTF